MTVNRKTIELAVVGLLFVTALISRVAYTPHGLPDFEQPDEIDFVGPALNLTFNLPLAIQNHDLGLLTKTDYYYGHPHGYSNILFVIFTGVKEIWQVVGGSVATWTKADFFVIARVVSGLLSFGAVVFTYLLARKLFGKIVGLLSLLFCTFFFYFISYAHTTSPYTVSGFFVVTFIYFWWRYFEKRTWLRFFIAAVLLGFASATNFGTVILCLSSALFLVWQFFKKQFSWSQLILRLLSLALITGVVFTILSPLTIVNWGTTLKALGGLAKTQQVGCLNSTSVFGPWYYFFGSAPANFGFANLRPASFSESSGIIFSVLVLLALILSLISKRLSLTFLGGLVLLAVALYSFGNDKSLRWLLPFLPLLLILMSYQMVTFWIHLRIRAIYLVAISLLLIIPNLVNDYYFLRAWSTLDTREQALLWIQKNISKDTAILRPTNFAPPIWRYGYKYDRALSHPLCALTKDSLSAQIPGPIAQYICDPNNVAVQTQYVVEIDAVVKPLLNNETAVAYPKLYSGWKAFYDTVRSYKKSAEFLTGPTDPRTGPNITIYKVPDFDCRPYNDWFWKNFKV